MADATRRAGHIFSGLAVRAASLIGIVTLMPLPMTPLARAQGEMVIASDNFNRVDESPFAVSGNWGRTIAGNYDGVSNLTNNQVTSVSKEGIYYWKGAGTFNPARQFARQRVVQKDGELGLVLLGGPDHSIMVAWGPPGVGNTVYIYWYSGGQDRGQLATGPSTVANGDIIEAVLDGGIIYAKVNGVTVKTVANTTTLTTGTPGFITYLDTSLPGQASILDDWEAGTPPSYTISGTITEDAAGLSGVLVTASGGFSGSTTTNGNGDFAITGVPSGAASVVITPTLSGHTMSPLTRTVAGPVAGDALGQNFTSTLNTGAVLTVLASHGSVTKDPDLASYAFGTEVTLTPVPDAGYAFAGWSGDVPAGHELDNPLHVTMNQDRTITADFTAPDVVASDDFNRANETPLLVGGNWQQPFGGGAANLTNNRVAGASGDALYYWQGAGTFDNARQFARVKVVQASGQVGLVLLGATDQALVVAWNAGTLYVYWFSAGVYRGNLTTASSTLLDGDIIEALLDGGIVYAKINGAVVASVNNTTTLSSGRPGFETYLTGAAFDDWEAGTPQTYSIGGTITENALGLSGVQVSASGGFGGAAATNGNGVYTITGVPLNATSIVLTPTLSGHTMSPLTRTVAGPVTANVAGQDFTSTLNTTATLTVNASHGSVTKDPDQPTYTLGTQVTLTPIPDAGYDFTSWGGDVPAGHATDNPLQVTMDQDRTITANFTAPGVVAYDDFNRANETPLAVGGNWQRPFIGGLVNLTNNRVTGASGEALYYWQGAGTFDNTRQFARATVVQAGGQVGLVLLGATDQALVVAWNSGTLFVYWYSAGTYRGNLTTASSTLSDGDVIEAILDGGKVYAKINGAIVKSVVNSTTLSSGRPGFETFLTGAVLDDWEAGTPPSYTISGTITENAVGLSGVQVTASGGFSGGTTTNGSGAYTITGVPSGAVSLVLTPTLSGHTMSPLTRTVVGPVTGDLSGEDFTSTLNTSATLTINATHGSVTKDPDQPTYVFGTEVTLTPIPDAGYDFANWSGDVPAGHELDEPLHVTMDHDRTITANFTLPGVVAFDNFNRANEFPLVVGGNWQRPFIGGLVNLTNNQVVGSTGEALYYWQGAGTFDNARQFARTRVVQAGGQVGLVLLGATDQALVVSWGGGRLFIYWYLNGSHQGELANEPSTLVDGDVIEAVLDQGTVSAKINGVVVKSVPNTTSLSSGRPGFETFLTGASFDDWEGGLPALNCFGAPNGTACSDGNACTQIDTCQAGVCVGSSPVVCTASDQCHAAGVCAPQTGTCSNPSADDGTACTDGNACTQTDTCQAGVCVGANPVVCTASDQCHVAGICDTETGVCSNPNAVDGVSCSDSSACTQSDTCQAGVCVGASPVVCTASDQCHVAGTCDPQSGICSNPTADDGTACTDGNACTQTDTCQTGVCVGANPVVCAASDQCHVAGTCDPQSGICSNPTADDGTACTDGNACTQTDTCQAGICVGAIPVVCTASDQCHVAGTCDPQTGVCSNPNAEDGLACTDGNACTQTDTCQAGICVGAIPVVCTASDQCHVAGTCDPQTGVCSNPNAEDGLACTDGNACTQTDTCQAGICVGANPVVCTASDQCHVAGTCDPQTGICSNPIADDGTACTDGNACTQTDTCQAGVCVGANPVVCTASDQCHVAGTCDPQTGACSNPNVEDGLACSDGTACTETDTCQAGVCVGSNPVVCAASDQCHVAGTCDPQTGICSNPAADDGTACADGDACTQTDTCQAGVCVGANPVVCTASDPCHVAGICDTQTGICSNPNANDGLACTDGNACTQSDSCQAGVCVGSNPVVCTASDQCHVAGTCDTQTGICSNPNASDGLACTDGNPCTQTDACQAGVCSGSNPVVCTASDQCHVAGICDTQTGICSNPSAANGTACTDGNACTQTDTCQAGVCSGSNPVVCAASDQCHVAGVCNTQSGVCSNPWATNGTLCDDGSACTTGDACNAGSCVGVAVPPPAEVQGLLITRTNPTKLSWTAVSGLVYDVASSTLAALRVSGTATATCLADNHGSASYNDNGPDPAPSNGYYYIIRAQSVCGSGTYGYGAGSAERLPTAACP